jgi:anti-anti-sigma factor
VLHLMQISIAHETASTAKVVLTGKLDMIGADVVALPLATLSGAKSGLIIDMTGVTFIVSRGARQLILAAKALALRGGSLILLNPSAIITDVLDTLGVNDVMKIVYSESEADAALQAQAR